MTRRTRLQPGPPSKITSVILSEARRRAYRIGVHSRKIPITVPKTCLGLCPLNHLLGAPCLASFARHGILPLSRNSPHKRRARPKTGKGTSSTRAKSAMTRRTRLQPLRSASRTTPPSRPQRSVGRTPPSAASDLDLALDVDPPCQPTGKNTSSDGNRFWVAQRFQRCGKWLGTLAGFSR